MMRRYAQLPDIVPTPLEGKDSWFSVIVPVARTNLITNPSFETNTTGWLPYFSGSPARSTAQQYHGAYSLSVTPTAALTDGVSYDVSLVSGTTYAVSTKFLGVAGKSYTLLIQTALAVELIRLTFTATGRWQWIWLYYTETASAVRTIIVRKNSHTSTAPFYLDGAQCEALANAGETVSTYIDGDQVGMVPNQLPAAYGWNGTPHNSTSYRSGQTRAGGMVQPLNYFNFLLAGIIGLGMATPQNNRTDYARIDGAFDDYTRKPMRTLTLLGRLSGLSSDATDAFRSALGAALDRDLVGLDQRLLLRYQKIGDCGDIRSNAGLIDCKYASGLGGNTDNHFAEALPLTFEQYLPYVRAEGSQGMTLPAQINVSNSNLIVQRSPAGLWSSLSTGMSGGTPMLALAYAPDGTLYAGGSFTDAGGSGADYIAKWNGSNWSVLKSATALNDVARAIVAGPDGRIYVGGSFTNVDGIANADGIAVYDPVSNTWAALGTGVAAGGSVRALAFDRLGNLYAGGDFTLMGGVANTARIAKWDGSAWTALGTGSAAGTVQAIVITPSNTLYAGGSFTNMGGVGAADQIAYWNGTAWSALSTFGITGTVFALALAPNGNLIAGGDFTFFLGLTTNFLASWNGVQATALGTFAGTSVYSLAFDALGNLYVGGFWTTLNGLTLPDSVARLTGTTFTALDIDLTGNASVFAIQVRPDGTLTLGHGTNATAIAASVTTVTNNGTGRSYPILKITGPSSGTAQIYQFINTTTNRAIYFNLTINAGETITMNFQPDNLSFVSSVSGNVAASILTGSNEADWFLQPGANSVSFYASGSSVTAVLYWQPQYTALDGLTR